MGIKMNKHLLNEGGGKYNFSPILYQIPKAIIENGSFLFYVGIS